MGLVAIRLNEDAEVEWKKLPYGRRSEMFRKFLDLELIKKEPMENPIQLAEIRMEPSKATSDSHVMSLWPGHRFSETAPTANQRKINP